MPMNITTIKLWFKRHFTRHYLIIGHHTQKPIGCTCGKSSQKNVLAEEPQATFKRLRGKCPICEKGQEPKPRTVVPHHSPSAGYQYLWVEHGVYPPRRFRVGCKHSQTTLVHVSDADPGWMRSDYLHEVCTNCGKLIGQSYDWSKFREQQKGGKASV